MSVFSFPRWAIAGSVAACALAGCATTPSATTSETAESPLITESAAMEPTDGATGDDAVADSEAMADVVVNDKLRFTASTVSGEPFDGVSLAGTDAILWFWASWCPTCQAEAPGVAEAAAQLPDGVRLYGVPGNSDQAGMENFIDAYGLGDVPHVVDPDGSLWSTFGVPYQPAFALINDNGEITVIQGSLGIDGILDAANSLLDS